MLNLRDDDFLGAGGTRCVYIHPDDPSLCIKILLRKEDWEWSKKEVRYLTKIQRWHQNSMECYARYHGNIETSQGVGRVFDLIRDKDNAISRTLENVLNDFNNFPFTIGELSLALDHLIKRMVDLKVVGRDIHPLNICVKRDGEKIELILIDGIGHSTFIPVLDWSKLLRKKHLNKHFLNIRNRMDRIAEGSG